MAATAVATKPKRARRARATAAARERKHRTRQKIGFVTKARQAAATFASLARILLTRAWRVLLGLFAGVRGGFSAVAPALRWMLRRWHYGAIPVGVALLALMLTPIGWDMMGGLAGGGSSATAPQPEAVAPKIPAPKMSASERSGPKLTLPKISMPKLSGPLITVPNISLPSFVKEPVEKFDRFLSGALVEERSRVLIADITDRAGQGEEDLGLVVAVVLEAELSRGSYFTVSPRERTLTVAGSDGQDTGLALRPASALSLAQATGSAALITGELTQEDSVRSLVLMVQGTQGEELYTLAVEIDEEGLLEAVGVAAQDLAHRLGEADTGEGNNPLGPFLTRSLPAAQAYVQARAHLYRSEFRQAAEAAQEATSHDSAFAAAHRLMAEAYALSGRRALARQALETAWEFRDRLFERERLRLAADRDALAGRHSEAILAYDFLFSQFRDDAAALKSQAILQELVGVRGGGSGNLTVAYSIDPVDWPPLERISSYLGYPGGVPSYGESKAEDVE
jgi:tetratricopeptide (TPR) repeat protein